MEVVQLLDALNQWRRVLANARMRRPIDEMGIRDSSRIWADVKQKAHSDGADMQGFVVGLDHKPQSEALLFA